MLKIPSRTTVPLSGGETAARLLSVPGLLILMAGAQLLVLWLSGKGSVFPGADALMSVIGTGAEVVAGLYGITMAGYTFFLSRMDALSAGDATLDYIIDGVKRRFKYLVWIISYTVMMTLLVSLVLMYSPVPSAESRYVFFYRLFCNEFVLSLLSSLGLIVYYSILVIDPKCLEKEAARLKKRLSRSRGPAGSAAEFIDLYDRIQTVCCARLPQTVLHQLQQNKGRRLEPVLELLHQQDAAVRSVYHDLVRIHRYYECMVNVSPLEASAEMCALARRTLQTLQQG
ncbi:MAG: hypothetical protein IJ347_09005 [Faecalibacterium sp.]|nr:hypothetical protein [Faecalibacterium sp.]